MDRNASPREVSKNVVDKRYGLRLMGSVRSVRDHAIPESRCRVTTSFRAYFVFGFGADVHRRICHNFRNRRSSNWSTVETATRNLERDAKNRFKTCWPDWLRGEVYDNDSNLVFTIAL